MLVTAKLCLHNILSNNIQQFNVPQPGVTSVRHV